MQKIRITHAEHYRESDNLFLNKYNAYWQSINTKNDLLIPYVKHSYLMKTKVVKDKSMLERYRKYKCCVFIDFEYIYLQVKIHKLSTYVSDLTSMKYILTQSPFCRGFTCIDTSKVSRTGGFCTAFRKKILLESPKPPFQNNSVINAVSLLTRHHLHEHIQSV